MLLCHVLRLANVHVSLDQLRSSAGVLKQLKQGQFMKSKLLPRDTSGIIPRCCSPVKCGCFVGSLESRSLAGGLANFINLSSFVNLITGTMTFMKVVLFIIPNLVFNIHFGVIPLISHILPCHNLSDRLHLKCS